MHERQFNTRRANSSTANKLAWLPSLSNTEGFTVTMTDTDTRVRDLHRRAMKHAEIAESYKRNSTRGNAEQMHAGYLRSAAAYETEAADLCTQEPARSVLYRSAATLALDAGEPAEAVRLAQCGLEGSPPEEIAVELREVLAKARGSAPNASPPVADNGSRTN